MNETIVSVLMSVYNTDASFLREAVDSVLAQTFENYELLIVDDCSDEKTKEILTAYAAKDQRIRVLTNEINMGLTKNLNRLISAAKGKYLARMDADDICFPERLKKQVEFLERNPDIAVVGTWFNIIKDQHIIGYKKEAFLPYQMKARLFFHNSGNLHSSMMMRRSVLCQANGLLYDETKKKTQDYDLWVRVTKHHKMYLLPEVLMSYRVSDGQISTAGAVSQSSFRDMIILDQLDLLMDHPTEEEKQIHLSFCTGQHLYPAGTYVQWGERLVKSNHHRHCYDTTAFDYYASRLILGGYLRSGGRKVHVLFIKCLCRYAIACLLFYAGWGWNIVTGHI